MRLVKLVWLVVPLALLAWLVSSSVGSARSLAAAYIGKAFDRSFYIILSSIIREALVWAYAVVAGTVALILAARK